MIRDTFSPAIANRMAEDDWVILQDSYRPEENLKFETLFALTNGYMGTRGAYEESTAISLPFTCIHGVFDKSETFMRELSNLPNWLGIKLYVEKQLLGVETCEVLEFQRALDIKNAFLARRLKVRDKQGRETLIEGIRLLSRKNCHMGAIQLWVTPLNYDGILEIESILDGAVMNFADAPRFKVKHTELEENSSLEQDGVYVQVKTRDFGLPIGMGCRLMVLNGEGESIEKNRQYGCFGETAVEFKDCDLKQGQTVQLHKLMCAYTGRDFPEDTEARQHIREAVSKCLVEGDRFTISSFLEWNKEIYQTMWEEADIQITGDDDLNRAIRFNIFHLMSTASDYDETVNVGAKLMHGEEYGGHAFWDTELFMLPFFSYVFPEKAGRLVRYRYHLLEAARKNAEKNGFKGAQYPWESADTGDEQCPDWTIEPDGTCYRCWVAKYEHHVTADVAIGGYYNYYHVTQDRNYLENCGLEILLETARFWASRFEYDKEHDYYQITQVTGPDEWHEPVDNNLFTNYLARWNMETALEVLENIRQEVPTVYQIVCDKIHLTEEEMDNWKAIIPKVYLPMGEDGLFEQFEGYFKLKNLVIEEYNQNDMPVRPAAMKGMRMSQTQFIKQADVVMLLYLLGDRFPLEAQQKNYDYYEKRTMHGSSLSPSIYAIMGLRTGRPDMAYRYLRRSAFLDLKDLQRNAREGFHAANSGGVWGSVVFGFGGVSAGKDGVLCVQPNMPEQWKDLSFRLHYRGRVVNVKITQDNHAEVTLIQGEPMPCRINGQEITIQ